MKKILKISLTVFTVLALAIGGYLLYIFKYKEYDVADEEIDEIVDDPYTIELPKDDLVESDEAANDADLATNPAADDKNQATSGNASTGGKQTPSQTQPAAKQPETAAKSSNQSTNTNKPSNTKPVAGPSQPASKPTVAAIKQKYEPSFSNLQSQADAKLGALVGRAKSEYTAKKANGEKISYGYFYNKYTGAAGALEASTDAAFNSLMSAVENDLAKHGYDKSYAQSFRDEYNATKKARKDGLLNQVTGL